MQRNKNRELGRRHRDQRTRLIAAHIDGTLCWWCGQPMYRDNDRNPDQRELHADHTTTRAQGGRTADRLLHASCNEQRGNGDRDEQRPALAAQRGGWAANRMDW